MNKFGILSILTVLSNVLIFFILRGPNANLSVIIITLGLLSLLGIILALISKKWLSGIMGILFKGAGFVFAFLLLLAQRIGG
ncbi:hypothetical protein [Bacillus massiliglaciei]|uniref:hypothetical protein n=1 Tax=Bacillus massiliglaciei TaxID=1816693 RepID=UPI000DA6094B|nr:hypothetical protein [Bacillus massiliglaciei]